MIFLGTLLCYPTWSQQSETEKDTVVVVPDQQDSNTVKPRFIPSAKKATFMSIVPGLGQVYNRQYWKTPIFAGGVTLGVYASIKTSENRKRYTNALNIRTDGDTSTKDEFHGILETDELLKEARKYDRRNNIAVVSTVYLYAMNLLDAYTSARIRELGEGHHAAKAGFYSALFPGLGQIYNKKYWKLPIVYGAFGVSVGFIIFNQNKVNCYEDQYFLRQEGIQSNCQDRDESLSDEQILEQREYYRKNLEVSYIAAGIVYALNIIDAIVDAHLYNFDVSDDLSMHINPTWIPSFGHGSAFQGLSISFDF